MLLTATHLEAAPWGTPLLRDINLNVASGEVLGVIGPNGAGKSSLLHVLAGGLPCTAGSLTLAGERLETVPSRRRACSIALLTQRAALRFAFTVREVVSLARTPHATGRNVDEQVVAEVMEATDISYLADKAYTQLSGGEQQRVQLARAVAQVWREEDSRHRLLLLDEPGSALDLAHQQQLKTIIRDLAARGCGVVVIAHDFNFMAAIADQVVLLECGHQQAMGQCEAVFSSQQFRQTFNVNPIIGVHPESGKPTVLLP